MNNSHVFISHSTRDDAFVKGLRRALEGLGLKTWVDSRELAGGAKLEPEVERAIEGARGLLAVLSPNAVNSPRVREEIRKALEGGRGRGGGGYRVVPRPQPGTKSGTWFRDVRLVRNAEVRGSIPLGSVRRIK